MSNVEKMDGGADPPPLLQNYSYATWMTKMFSYRQEHPRNFYGIVLSFPTPRRDIYTGFKCNASLNKKMNKKICAYYAFKKISYFREKNLYTLVIDPLPHSEHAC